MEHFCTYCGAILDKQEGFDPKLGIWICKKCGGILHGEQAGRFFEDIDWFCDKCGAYLNVQEGFTDYEGTWRCKECGYENQITEDEIIKDNMGNPIAEKNNYTQH